MQIFLIYKEKRFYCLLIRIKRRTNLLHLWQTLINSSNNEKKIPIMNNKAENLYTQFKILYSDLETISFGTKRINIQKILFILHNVLYLHYKYLASLWY